MRKDQTRLTRNQNFQTTDNNPMILLMEEILHQLIDRLSHYLWGFIHLRWCRILSINSRMAWMPTFVLLAHRPLTCKPSKSFIHFFSTLRMVSDCGTGTCDRQFRNFSRATPSMAKLRFCSTGGKDIHQENNLF